MFVDLMVFDLPNEQGGVSQNDFEECLAEFMLEHYFVEDDTESFEEISKILIKIRNQFTQSATES